MAAKAPPPAECASIHPASLLLIWLGYALCIPWLRTLDLAVITGVLIATLLLFRCYGFLRLLRRTRWLLISLILIYAFATPGDLLFPGWGSYSPTREGLYSGGLQALRLMALLSGLAVVLAALSGNRVLVGLYFLLRPLAPLGVDIDRLSARIWLTLHYAGQRGPTHTGSWLDEFRAAAQPGNVDSAVQSIHLEVPGFTWMDYLVLALSGALLALLVVRGIA